MPDTAVIELYNVSYMKEAAFGVVPSTPVMVEQVQNRFTLRGMRDKLESRRRLGDGQVANNRLGRKRTEGEIEVELSLTDNDHLLEAAFGSEFPTPFSQIAVSTISFTASTQVIADSGSGFGDIAVGDWIISAGAQYSANNGVFYVTVAGAGAITVAMGPTALVDEAVGASVTIDQQVRMENDVEIQSLLFEGRHTDTDDYLLYSGTVCPSMNLEANDELAIVRFNLMGVDQATDTSSVDATVTPAAENLPMDSLGGPFMIDGAAARYRNIRLDMQRNRTISKPLGSYVGDEAFGGRCIATGSFSIYFESKDLIDDFWAETHKGLRFSFIDPAGNYYTIYIYRALITEFDREEEDEAVVINYSFDALRHATNLKTVAIAKVTV